jgi:AraC family transcriptional regulator of arabinose operon
MTIITADCFPTMSKETRNDRKIARSIAFISLHINDRITMTQLAERVGLSSSYFWALFKQKTGYAPIDFMIRLRMHQACQLLKSTDKPVNEIAAGLGYHDPLYFSRAFKSILGVAPTRYRGAGLDTLPLPPVMVPVPAK